MTTSSLTGERDLRSRFPQTMPTTKAEAIRREIGGTPYLLLPNKDGYGVSAASSKTDRFHRNYQVYVKTGSPDRCTCASCVRGKRWCKHLRAVETLLREQTSAVPQPAPLALQTRYVLEFQDKARSYTFSPKGETVVVERKQGPSTTEVRVLPLDAARRLYAWLLKIGYVKW